MAPGLQGWCISILYTVSLAGQHQPPMSRHIICRILLFFPLAFGLLVEFISPLYNIPSGGVMLPHRCLTLISRRTMYSFARKSLWKLPPASEPQIPQQEPVDEELCPGYNSAKFYPANPGEVLAERFQLLVKIGWGSQSTVWLARDISR